MIVELSVENLAIIERSRIALGPGFTVLTGETGAGKSLLIDAIELAIGERADTELVRTGAAKAAVSLVVNLSDQPAALAKCVELGITLEENVLYIQREVFAEGRSQCRVGGRMVPVSALRQLGQLLVDLHGQHDHQSLLDGARHVSFLDAWIGEAAAMLLGEVSAAFAHAEECRRKLQALRAGMRDREHRLDLLHFQINEIEATDPRPGEMPELEAQLSRLKHAEKLASAAFGALEVVGDRENCAIELLGTAVKALEDCVRFDAILEDLVSPIREALYLSEEGQRNLRSYAEGLEADPAKLEEAAARIDALRRLRRKYGDDEGTILDFLDTARRELDLLEDSEASEEGLAADADNAQQRLYKGTAELSALRKARAKEFSELVQTELRDLAMDRAIFEVNFKTKPADAEGADLVEFFFSANPGEVPRPLAKIASGGEISRVMLALKTSLAGRAGVPTLIFDEVDAGLGGRAAATVARKLQELAEHYQVVVISHLPQIAGRAAAHYRIEKFESEGRVVTDVRLLSGEERIEEVARMLAGEHVTDSAIEHAREMLGLASTAGPANLFEEAE